MLCQSKPLVLSRVKIHIFSSSCLSLLGLSGFTHDLYHIRKSRTSPAFAERDFIDAHKA